MLQFMDMLYISKRHTRNIFKWIKICKVRDPWNPDHRDIDLSHLLLTVKPLRQTVFVFHLDLQVRCHANYRDATSFFQHLHTGIKNGFVPSEFVDDQTLYHLFFLIFQKHHRTDQLGKYAAAVDISDQKHRCFYKLGHTHIDDIILL